MHGRDGLSLSSTLFGAAGGRPRGWEWLDSQQLESSEASSCTRLAPGPRLTARDLCVSFPCGVASSQQGDFKVFGLLT